MKRLVGLTILILVVAAMPGLAQPARRAPQNSFASDYQTLPVVANLPGAGGTFQSSVTILNPTASAFTVTASLYDGSGTKKDAQIQLAAGEQKTYANFLDAVFHTSGGGAVVFQAPESAGGTHNNRFIVSSEVRTSGTHFGTSIPAVEFTGSNSRSFSPGITVDSGSRTNVGCFNQSDVANTVKATILDASGTLIAGTVTLNLAANGWGQAGVSAVVSNGMVQFEPSESAVCYAVVVDNTTNDGRYIPAAEYRP